MSRKISYHTRRNPYFQRFLKVSLGTGAISLSLLWYFANKLDENSFVKKHYKNARFNIAKIDCRPLKKNSTRCEKALAYGEEFIFEFTFNFQLFLAAAAIGLSNELWKNDLCFQALSYFIINYMNFVFLSVPEENCTSYGNKKQVFFRGECAHDTISTLNDSRGSLPVLVQTGSPTLPFVSDVTLREGRASAFKSDEDELEPCTYLAGLTLGLISLTSHLPTAKFFAGGNGVVLLTVPETYICGAQHACKEEYPLDEYEYMVPGLHKRQNILGAAFFVDHTLSRFEYNENFSGDTSELIMAGETRFIIESLPDSHPKKQTLLDAIDEQFDPRRHFNNQLVDTRERHYEITQAKLKKQKEAHPHIARLLNRYC